MEKQKELEKLNLKIDKCKKCLLWKGTHCSVPGEGPASARVMFLGESPGREEDLCGLPFVGRAGKLLTRLMEENGIDRKKVFVTSPIKHRPPKNRPPKKEEISACLPYLLKQIDIISPRKIILLGGVAFSVFFPKQKLGEFRGKWVKKEGRQFFVTYHPAAGLRSPRKMKKILEKDFRKVRLS